MPLVPIVMLALVVPSAEPVDFEREVRPILVRSCLPCHGDQKQRSGFRLDRKADALKGGDLGRAIVPGKASESPLYRYVSGVDPDLAMPPDPKKRLAPAEVAVLKRWIDGGARWPDDGSEKTEVWWSLKPLANPAAPGFSATLVTAMRGSPTTRIARLPSFLFRAAARLSRVDSGSVKRPGAAGL